MIFLLSALAFGIFSACAQAERPLTATELLDLGERYLLDLNFEQALVHFTALIEIEPMNPRGYTGAAEAYIGLGRVDDAVAVLRLGYERTSDSSIQQMLDEILPSEVIGEVIDEVTAMYEPDYEEAIGLTDEQHERFLTEAIPLLNELAYLVFAGDDEILLDRLTGSGELVGIFFTFPDEAFPILADTEHGRIGVYRSDWHWGSRYFVYIGEYAGDVRVGFGTWLSLVGTVSIAEGEWTYDMPNGHFNVRSRHTASGIETIHTSTGNVVNGLWHGERLGSVPVNEHIFMYLYDNGLVILLETNGSGNQAAAGRCIVNDGHGAMHIPHEWVNRTNGISGFSERDF